MIILLSNQAKTWILSILIIVGAILLIGAILYLIFGFRKDRENKEGQNKIVVDDSFIDQLLEGLGKQENIKEIGIINGRVKFTIEDTDKINTDILKDLSPSGVFITGNNVKLLFKYDAETVIKMLDERGLKLC